MLKIKNYLFNEDEIKYIKPNYRNNVHNSYTIEIIFKDDDYLDIYFYSQEERDEELNRVLKKVEEK